MGRDDLLTYLRSLIGNGSQLSFAEAIGVSPQYLSEVLNGRRDPGNSILEAIGVERIVTYRFIRPTHEDTP